MVNKFWWEAPQDKQNYLTLCNFESLCIPKNVGGLGFRGFAEFNGELVAKLGWKILHEKENSWVKVVTQKSLNKKEFFEVEISQEPEKDDKPPPYSSQESVMARLSGSGSSIKIWLEKWVLDKLIINVVHGGRSMGIDLQERVEP